jgi:hypothetical protein
MYRLIKKGLVYNVPKKKGIYTLEDPDDLISSNALSGPDSEKLP